MRNLTKTNQHEKGSALLIVMMMIIMLTILVMEISFSSQTAYSLAKNQIERIQMNAVSETGFAYAYNIVQMKGTLEANKSKTPVATPAPQATSPEKSMSGMSIFAKADTMDSNTAAGPENLPPWKNDFQVVTVGKIQMKLKINLEESKININRLVNSEDKVDMRIRTALIELFKLFEGTEDDIDRIIDYIDVNSLGQHETGALNGPAQSLGEILAIPNISLKYSLEDDEADSGKAMANHDTNDSNSEKPLTLGDIITVKSTGRININYASEDVLKGIINGQQERPILETILQGRSQEPFKTMNQLAYNKQFASTFKKIANYLTIDENTFYVKVILKSKDNTVPRIYYGYLYNSLGIPKYILRTERIGGNDPELIYDAKSMENVEDTPDSELKEVKTDEK